MDKTNSGLITPDDRPGTGLENPSSVEVDPMDSRGLGATIAYKINLYK